MIKAINKCLAVLMYIYNEECIWGVQKQFKTIDVAINNYASRNAVISFKGFLLYPAID